MKIFLKKNEGKRLKSGHPWAFSNEILKIDGAYENGDICELYTYQSDFIGKGFFNKNSLISYRHLTCNKNDVIDRNFFFSRLKQANDRRNILKRNVYRMVNSESDFLPGLIIDRFENAFSLQVFSLGMNKFLDIIKNILIEDFNAHYIVEKDDNELRSHEGLEKINKVLYKKSGADFDNFIVDIDDVKYFINLIEGQKTGFYLDQVGNRKLLGKFIKKDDKVLDLFCNEGGFALISALCGASEVVGVDSSVHSIMLAKKNSLLNNLHNIKFIQQDVFEFLEIVNNGLYDVIILDPPSFTKTKKNIASAVKGYIKLNAKVMQLLKPESLLFTFSCSYHINEAVFEEIIRKSSCKSGRKVQILHFSNSSLDHPVLPYMEESKYLKSYLLRII